MRKIVYISFIFILCIAQNSYAQNLIPNYSFEVYDTCPFSAGQIYYVQPWGAAVVNSSSDYYNACSVPGNLGIPSNFAGNQNAKDGNAYAGIVMYASPSGTNWREYLQVQLTSALTSDSCYRFTCYISIADDYKFNITNLGAYFSFTAVNTCDACVLSYSPQINYTDASGIGDTSGWYKVEAIFQAQGGEQYMTIGNFNLDASTTPIIVNTGGGDVAYNYIDSVSLVKVTCPVDIGINENSKSKFSFHLYPNPNNGTMLLDYNLNPTDKAEFKIYDVTGKLVSNYILNSSFTQIQINNDLFSNGIYFYQIMVNDQVVQADKLVIIK